MPKEDPVGYPDFTLPVVHVGAITVEGSVSVLGTVEVKGAVTVSGTVSVSGTVEVTGAVTVSGTVSVEGTVTVTGSVTVSGTVSISGTVEVTGSVTVTGAVTVGTVAADNIIIDKLTVGAYTERRSTLSNNGATPAWTYATGDSRRGKFFPRGCRGFINTIDVYCKDAGAAGGTITVYISPHPSMGYVAIADVTVGAGASADWRSATFNRMWNYDSLFIFVLCSSSDINHGYDSGTPYDYYTSSDAGATWATMNYRNWFRAVMKGETVGDVPVSGVVNVVEIPTVLSGFKADNTGDITHGTTVDILPTIHGTGKLTAFQSRFCCVGAVSTSLFNMVLGVVIDGVTYEFDMVDLGASVGTTKGIKSPAPVCVSDYDTTAIGETCTFAFNFSISFRRSLRLYAKNNDPDGSMRVDYFLAYELIK